MSVFYHDKKNRILLILFPLLVCFVSIFWLSALWMREYREAVYVHISALCETIAEEYPGAERAALDSLKTLQEYMSDTDTRVPPQGGEYLARYGYESRDFSGGIPGSIFFLTAAAPVLTALMFLLSFSCLHGYCRTRAEELVRYLRLVNSNLPGSLIQKTEDTFSKLQDEICKTVTELYRTREAALRAKENFADNLANIAHQLKTPLTAAFLSLRLMEESSPSPHTGQIERQLRRLNCLEESLLSLSKIDSGALVLKKSPVDIYTILTMAAENLEDFLQKAHVQVSVPDKGCALVCGDSDWLMEAFMNLMKNCMEHSAVGQTIYCDYSSNPLYTEVLVWDEGEGFKEEELSHLFERFYRGKHASGDGIGIGLSLARSILEMQNGVISARNLPRGGACFEIRIYCHQDVTLPCYHT